MKVDLNFDSTLETKLNSELLVLFSQPYLEREGIYKECLE